MDRKWSTFMCCFQWWSCYFLLSVAAISQTVCSLLIDFQSVFGVYSMAMCIVTLFLGCTLVDGMVLWVSVDVKTSCTSLWNTPSVVICMYWCKILCIIFTCITLCNIYSFMMNCYDMQISSMCSEIDRLPV